MTAVPTLKVSPSILNPVYLPFLTDTHPTQIYFGGSSSGKSYFLAQRAVLDVLQGRNYLILRNVAKTIRSSCWNEICKAIQKMNLTPFFQISKTDLLITATNNGSQIMFAGLDDVEKVKSITPAKGVITDIWVEESTEIEYEDFKQLEKRLRGLSKHMKRLTLSFNPIYKTHWIYREFFGIWEDGKNYASDSRLSILKTTHKDNRFLAQEDHEALENEKDPYYYDVYTLGNWGVLGDLIFRNWKTDDLSEFAKSADRIYYGLDFGFSSDPCGVVKAHLDKAHKRIYILDELCERGLTNTALAGILKPFVGAHYITCDSAEPKSIKELQQLGINALSAKKGPDSVMHGIQWLQGYEIIVDTHCQHIKNELAIYQWQKDKDGNSLRKPEDKNNHLIDALRYALETESLAQYATTMNRAALGI